MADKKLTQKAQYLRKNMTPEERKLWYDFLKGLPYTINRQKMIGGYIVDFYCSKAKLVIELDGGHHFTADGIEYDKIRDKFLADHGITVFRIPNSEIHKDFGAVCSKIRQYIET